MEFVRHCGNEFSNARVILATSNRRRKLFARTKQLLTHLTEGRGKDKLHAQLRKLLSSWNFLLARLPGVYLQGFV